MTRQDVEAFERCVRDGGVAVFPADTVYGLACDPDAPEAVARLYGLKGRVRDKPAAVMFFALDGALAAVPELGGRTARALARLLPGAVTVLLPDPRVRSAQAGASDPPTLGLRVPRLTGALSPLAALRRPVLQSSANVSGGADPRCVGDIPLQIRRGVDLILDAGELPGTPSTVVDLRRYEQEGEWSLLREGPVPVSVIAEVLAGTRSV